MHQRIEFSDVAIHGTGKERGSLVLAMLAGSASSVIAVACWIGFTAVAGQSFGYAVIVSALLVSLAVRWTGDGATSIFGLVGAVFTLFASFACEYFAVVLTSIDEKFDFYAMMLHLDPISTGISLYEHATPLACVIYALSLLAAYRISYRVS